MIISSSKEKKKSTKLTLPVADKNQQLSKTFRFSVQAISDTNFKLTAFSNTKVNYIKLLPGELKQFDIEGVKDNCLFFKIPSQKSIQKVELSVLAIQNLKNKINYKDAFVLEKYHNMDEEPQKLAIDTDYSIKKEYKIISILLTQFEMGMYALKFGPGLKGKDFSVILRLSFNDLQILNAYSSQHIRVPAQSSVDFQIPLANSSVWDVNGYSCTGPLQIYFNTQVPEFHDQDLMKSINNESGQTFEFSKYVDSRKSVAIYMNVKNPSDSSIDLMFNSKIRNAFADYDYFSSLSINDQISYDDIKIAELDLSSEQLFFDLGFPLISPNLAKHYSTADYLRFSYEFYQIPSTVTTSTEIPSLNPSEEKEKLFQQLCKLIDEISEEEQDDSSNYKPIAKSPLMVSNIIYKKQTQQQKNQDENISSSSESNKNQEENTNDNDKITFVPDHILTKNVESVQTKFIFPFFMSNGHTEYYMSNHLDTRKLILDGIQLTKQKIEKSREKSFIGVKKGESLKVKFFVFRKLEVMEDPEGNFIYGSFILNPKTIDYDLSDGKLRENIKTTPKSSSSKASDTLKNSNQPDTAPIRKKKEEEKHLDKNNVENRNPNLKVMDNVVRKNKESIWDFISDSFLKILVVFIILLLVILCLVVIRDKRKLDREGYTGSLTGDFEAEGIKVMDDTSRSIEIGNYETRKNNGEEVTASKDMERKEREIELQMQSYQTEAVARQITNPGTDSDEEENEKQVQGTLKNGKCKVVTDDVQEVVDYEQEME